MGLIGDLIRKYMNKEEEPVEEIPDDVTRDKYLRYLRRENRMIHEEAEKKYLKKKIADYRKKKLRTELFGIKDKINKKKENKASFLKRYEL